MKHTAKRRIADGDGASTPLGARRVQPPAGHCSHGISERVYWAMSRLTHHGWTVEQFGPHGWSGRDEAGQQHVIDARAYGFGDPSLPLHVGRLLAHLGRLEIAERTAAERLITAKLRLHMPARKAHPDDARTAWLLPTGQAQPCAPVRQAYWAALTLTDDYGWQITNVGAAGFDAITPGAARVTPFRPSRRCVATTAATLANLLASMEGRHIIELADLISAHRRASHTTLTAAMGDSR
ncbi:hypothetical protein [Mycobacterium sp. SMC-4]|uniref:hypothetical protein n=1 Tax=Mycobacterium sp. SMC-4 TaxID=2857059 RepID=UPI001F271A4A|nr:hypothetical protein [Mycobacterium sp. SMC-4]MCF6390007.1 hypothetical protein [Mycobacterium sp. MBM]UXA21270.1 hypothetical protein KXD98_27600 [Mycobacterium sp. SMC-4]